MTDSKTQPHLGSPLPRPPHAGITLSTADYLHRVEIDTAEAYGAVACGDFAGTRMSEAKELY
jgi:hypothetical protein